MFESDTRRDETRQEDESQNEKIVINITKRHRSQPYSLSSSDSGPLERGLILFALPMAWLYWKKDKINRVGTAIVRGEGGGDKGKNIRHQGDIVIRSYV